jgi:hypothetical protein
MSDEILCPDLQGLQAAQKRHQVLLFLQAQVQLLYEIKIFHRILKGKAAAVMQIGRGILDAP